MKDREEEDRKTEITSEENLDLSIDVPVCHQRFLKSISFSLKSSFKSDIFLIDQICQLTIKKLLRKFWPQRISASSMENYSNRDRKSARPTSGYGYWLRQKSRIF